MLKTYLIEKNISVYALSKKSGIAYSTLNDLSNGKVDIENCRLSLARKLAVSLGVSIDELCAICAPGHRTVTGSYGGDINIKIHNKSYHVDFSYGDELIEMKLCKVNDDSSFYIDDIAKWRVDSYIMNRRMEEFR